LPRKAKLFRVVVDRKLGIDWEHSVKSSEEDSLQTYQVQEGYDELNRNTMLSSTVYDTSKISLKQFLFNTQSQIKDKRSSSSINSEG
jgi:hypothetical protein